MARAACAEEAFDLGLIGTMYGLENKSLYWMMSTIAHRAHPGPARVPSQIRPVFFDIAYVGQRTILGIRPTRLTGVIRRQDANWK